MNRKPVISYLLLLIIAISTPAITQAHTGGARQKAPGEYEPAPPSLNTSYSEPEEFCPENERWKDWRKPQVVKGIRIEEDQSCRPDNPKTVAAVTMGTNNMPKMWQMKTGLDREAVQKCCDKDDDGDPDVINITLEVSEINGKEPPETGPNQSLTASQHIAPGVNPGMWAFTPKSTGMATEGGPASNVVRFPSPAIRVEKTDTIHITLENTHYMPHTIHFHGVDHPFSHNGDGNDGVPQTSEKPISPGNERTYTFTPKTTGTNFYHCHVQPKAHVLMGLQGMFIVEEERENNTLQTLNIGNGKVRHPSKSSQNQYDSEYDLQYQGIDKELHSIINLSNDPRIVSKAMNRGYDVTEREPDYFVLNGKSFPYTIRESMIIAKPNESIKLRLLNGGAEDIALHTHGHKGTITHYDGVEAPTGSQIQRDVYDVSAAQRLDILLNTTNDGLNSYGKGVWFMHNHKEEGVTTDGIGPGGDITTITYEQYLKDNGFPQTQGVSWKPYFTEEYYDRQIPVWQEYSNDDRFRAVQPRPTGYQTIAWYVLIGLLSGIAMAGIIFWVKERYET